MEWWDVNKCHTMLVEDGYFVIYGWSEYVTLPSACVWLVLSSDLLED